MRPAFVLVPVFAVFVASQFRAADPPLRAGRLPKELVDALKPGLTLAFTADGKTVDARRVRLPALHVPAGTPASPMLPPGPFAATASGYFKVANKGEYRFRVTGSGSVVLRVNGTDVLKADDLTKESATATCDLAKGYNRIELAYTPPKAGDATVRLDWAGDGFAFEPLPPDQLFTKGDEAELVAGTTVRDGRYLYATLGCSKCHALPKDVTAEKAAMPEMKHRAPSLVGAGSRFTPEWLTKWIADPQSVRPSATMPKVLHGDATAQAADIAAYLTSLSVAKFPADPNADLAAEGEKHFERLACVACHTTKAPDAADPYGRLSLHFTAAKFKPGALEAFLKAPHADYPWSRMPDFHLDAKELPALTAFLRKNATGTVDAFDPAKASAERGEKLFQSAGCANCHATKPDESLAKPTLPVPPAEAKGCLAEKRGEKSPAFHLTEPQRAALVAFLKTDGSSLTRETPAEFSLRQVEALQCTACHRRDGGQSRLRQVLVDEGDGSEPEVLPLLTWTGEKLRTDWTAGFLAGKFEQKARPWLKGRMPAFPARAEVLAAGLSHEHGYPSNDPPRPKPNLEQAAIGEKLTAAVGGLNCVNCHGMGKKPAVAPFEAPGINLLDAAFRIRPDYYTRWMLDVPRVDTNARMPKFTEDGKTTGIKDVLGGDASKQFDALWHFIHTLPGKDGK